MDRRLTIRCVGTFYTRRRIALRFERVRRRRSQNVNIVSDSRLATCDLSEPVEVDGHKRCFLKNDRRKTKNMKTFIRTVLFLAVVSIVAPSTFAVTTEFTNVPDGGSSIAMITLALAGLGAMRKFRR